MIAHIMQECIEGVRRKVDAEFDFWTLNNREARK
jgi:hypothetical protein